MRKIILVPFLLLLGVISAQKHELGVFLGSANAISDVGRTSYVSLMPLKKMGDSYKLSMAVGGFYKYNLNPQQGIKLSLSYASIAGNDDLAVEDYRNKRGVRYSNSILELAVVFEYDFLPINREQESAHSPYVFAGIGGFGTNKPVYKANEKGEVDFGKEIDFALNVPFGIGYKYKFNWNWIVGAEVGFRPTFVDYIDFTPAQESDFDLTSIDSEEKKKEIIESKQIGNSSSNDWYVFTGVSLRYTFGRPACFCD